MKPKRCALPGCGKLYVPKTSNSKYCSPEHSKAANYQKTREKRQQEELDTYDIQELEQQLKRIVNEHIPVVLEKAYRKKVENVRADADDLAIRQALQHVLAESPKFAELSKHLNEIHDSVGDVLKFKGSMDEMQKRLGEVYNLLKVLLDKVLGPGNIVPVATKKDPMAGN